MAYTEAAIALQNYLRTTKSSSYCPPGYVDGVGNQVNGSWRSDEEACTGLAFFIKHVVKGKHSNDNFT